MNLTTLGTLVSGLTALLFLLVTLVTFRTRRLSREARELRELRTTNIAFARWKYQIEMLAAIHGWDTRKDWPVTPKELTLSYLEGKAEGENNVELANIVQVMQGLTHSATPTEQAPSTGHSP